jgi:hypothetical protein
MVRWNLAVFMTSRGQCIIYSGTDPTSSSNWTLVGVFNLPPPLGVRCTVKQTSAGVRTPRGKIEIILEKDGKRRLAIWGASTTINVQRMEQ